MNPKTNKMKNTTTYALIDNGEVSGKHPFIYCLGTKSTCLHFKKICGYITSPVILISPDEEKYINSINEGIEVLYYAGGKTIENKFFY